MSIVSDAASWLTSWSPMTILVVMKATLLLLLAAMVSAAMRRASASARHTVWHLALIALVAMLVLPSLLPEWRIAPPESLSAIRTTALVAPRAATSLRTMPADDGATGKTDGAALLDDATRQPGDATVAGAAVPAPARVGLGGIIALLWAAGALSVLGWLLVGHLWLRTVARRSRPVQDGVWLRSVHELCCRLELRRPVMVLRSDAAVIPATCGLLWPALLLPACADDWPDAHRTSVLCHELAHVKRFDCLTQLVAQLACALFWFHPLAWYAARRLLVERERACDDMVLAFGTRPSDYATHLIDIARALAPARLSAPATVSMARPSQLEGRLLAVLDPRRRRALPLRRLGYVPAIVMLAVVLPLASIEAGAMPVAPGDSALIAADSAMEKGAGGEADTTGKSTVIPASVVSSASTAPSIATTAAVRRIRALAHVDGCTAAAEHSVTLPVADARRVRVESDAGKLWIEGRAGISEIRILGIACAADIDDLDDMRLGADRHRETLGIEARVDRHARHALLHLLVEVPAGMAVDVEDARGDTEIRDVGRLRIEDGSGDLFVERVRGSVRVEDGSDDIDIRAVDGSVMVAEDRAGDIRVAGIKGDFDVEHRNGGLIDWLDVAGEVHVPMARN